MKNENVNSLVAWLFDVDGVLTNPEKKRVVLPEIFDELIKRLEINEPVGLNTGRSLEFVINEILIPIENRITNKKLLKNIFAIGEKGAVWIFYDNNGNKEMGINEDISVPEKIINEVFELVKKIPYSDVIFFDETKKTMVSVELKLDMKINDLERIKQLLIDDLQKVLNRYHLENELKIDITSIAVDVENIKAGKALGARKFVDLLDKKEILPKEYICFGDSTSDYDMYEELKFLEKKVKFVFVGGEGHLGGKNVDDVEFTRERFDKGTLSFLHSYR